MNPTQNTVTKVLFPDVVFFQEGPGLRNWQWTDDGMKVINVTNILEDGSINVENTDKYISIKEFEERYSHFAIAENDVVVASSGNSYGKVGRIKTEHLPLMMNTSVIRFHSRRSDLLDEEYLFAFLRSAAFRSQVEQFVTGGAQPNFGPSHINKMWIPLPPLSLQRRIGSILSAYDKLIANNLHRIKLLGILTGTLYKEWFVRLRFPEHGKSRAMNGVPEGWKRFALKDVCESINYGFTASAQDDHVGPKLLRITDIVPPMIDWASVPYCKIPEEKRNKVLLREGDIVIARTGATVGYAKRLHRRHPETVFASYLVRLRIRPDVDNILIGIFVESDLYKNYVKSQIGGAAQPNANAQVLTRVKLLIPPANIQKLFHEIVEPMLDQKEILQIQNQKLWQARDILLGKLMNGEMKV